MKEFARFYILTTILAITLFANAADNTETKNLYWITVHQELKLPKQFNLSISVIDRRLLGPDKQFHLLLNAGFGYTFKKHFFANLGFTHFQGRSIDQNERNDPIRPELRPFQNVGYAKTFGKTKLTSRFQIEERYIHNFANGQLADGYTLSTRIRFLLKLNYTFLKKQENKHHFGLFLFNELFLQFGINQAQAYDQNRASVGISYKPVKLLAINLGYLNWYQHLPSGIGFLNLHNITLNIKYTLNLRK